MDKREPSLLDLLKAVRTPPAKSPSTDNRLLIESLEINNVWCYKHERVDFEEGITVIAGPNGSGKSSLLESIFFALYASKAGPAMERTLTEILRVGTDAGSVRLTFAYGPHRYTATITLRRRGDKVESERSECKLARDDGVEWVGVENVTAAIERFFNMDRDDFTNCVYVRQGEIDRLIRANDEERKQMIDRLLRLERLDSYVTRAKEGARRAINRKSDILRSKLTDLQREIEFFEKENLHQKKLELSKQIELKQEELEKVEAKIAELEAVRHSWQEQLARFDDMAKEIAQLSEESAKKKEKLKGLELEEKEWVQEIKTLQQEDRKLAAKLSEQLKEHQIEAESVLESLKEAGAFEEAMLLPQALEQAKIEVQKIQSELQKHKDELAQLSAEITRLECSCEDVDLQIADLKTDLASKHMAIEADEREVASLKAKLDALKESAQKGMNKLKRLGLSVSVRALEELELPALKEEMSIRLRELESEHKHLSKGVIEKQTQKREAEQQLKSVNELVRVGKCPTCKQPVTKKTVADTLEHLKAHLKELEGSLREEEVQLAGLESEMTRLKSAKEVLDSLVPLSTELRSHQEQLEFKRTSLKRTGQEIKKIEGKIEGLSKEKQESEQKLSEQRENATKLKQELDRLSEALESSQAKLTALEECKELVNKLLRANAQLMHMNENRKRLLNTMSDLRTDLANLEERVNTLKLKLGDREALERQEKEALARLQKLRTERDARQREYEALVDQRGTINSRIQHSKKLETEKQNASQQLAESERIKAELGEITQVYSAVKKELRQRNIEALNFYFNDFFSLMDAGDSYSRVTMSEDCQIEVELKNGRRIQPTLMSGGERALINIALRCAIHQVMARAIRKMPLILDEPTVYLDRDRVNRLQFLLEELGKRIGQVIVVSHEIGLVEGADHEYRTEKGSDNISTIRKIR